MRSLEVILTQIHATSRNNQLSAMKRVLIIQNLSVEALKALKGGEAYARELEQADGFALPSTSTSTNRKEI